MDLQLYEIDKRKQKSKSQVNKLTSSVTAIVVIN